MESTEENRIAPYGTAVRLETLERPRKKKFEPASRYWAAPAKRSLGSVMIKPPSAPKMEIAIRADRNFWPESPNVRCATTAAASVGLCFISESETTRR